MEDLYYFHINSFSFFFRLLAFRVVFFYIPIYQGYYALPCNDFKTNMHKEKTNFKMAKSIIGSNIFNGKQKLNI